MLSFEPYELLLEAVVQRGDRVTTLDWVETWWNTHGCGSSRSNRTEGSSSFGRLADFAGLGAYIQGRRGHPSRVEWAHDTLASATTDRTKRREIEQAEPPSIAPPGDSSEGQGNKLSPSGPRLADAPLDSISLNLPLGPGRIVEIRLPACISAAEKDRLIQLLEFLIAPAAEGGPQEEEG